MTDNLRESSDRKYLHVDFKLQLFLQFSLQHRHTVLNLQDICCDDGKNQTSKTSGATEKLDHIIEQQVAKMVANNAKNR